MTNDKDKREYPHRIPDAHAIAYVVGATVSRNKLENYPNKRPSAHPIKIPGKNKPAGTAVPYVTIVKIYHTTKNINKTFHYIYTFYENST